MIVLGIESSCDETAAAVVGPDRTVLSSVVASQVDVHHKYGGVVPELASRMHMEAIVPVVSQAIDEAGVGMSGIEGVAATMGPGLVGALLVGFSFAKSFAWTRKVPWTGVNHLEGHIHSVLLSDNAPEYPFTLLLVSGGHTNLYHIPAPGDYRLMGQTRDDAAGEAFDKVSKMLGLGYPGGAVIESKALAGNGSAIDFPRSYLDKEGFDFSFSGLKSAVSRHIQEYPDLSKGHVADITASFQQAVFDVLSLKLLSAARKNRTRHICVAGGVAANGALARRLERDASENGLTLHVPPRSLCGDNAAMIASRGMELLQEGIVLGLDSDVFSRNRFL